MKQTRTLAVFAAMLFLASVAIYRVGLNGPLLFDDLPALTANSLVQISGNAVDEWRVASFSSNSGPLRRPLTMVTFAANFVAAGEFSPFWLKAVNLSIHLGIGLLLYFLFWRVLRALGTAGDHEIQRLLALTGVAIWLLHPLHVSTVLYAVQRMAQLASLFVVTGLLVYMRYRQRWALQGAATGEVLAASLWLVLLTALATLSKENGVLLPWLIVVVEVCIFRGVWAGRTVPWLNLLGCGALLTPVIMVGLLLLASPESINGGYANREFSLVERVLTQARLLWTYLSWLVLPDIREMGFQHDDIALSTGLFSPISTAVALLAWTLAIPLAFLLRYRLPLVSLAVLFYLVAHSMESSVLALEMVYEHRNYLPSIFVCLLLASLLLLPFKRYSSVRSLYPVTGVLLVLSILLFVRVQTWSDELTLSRVNVQQHTESSRSNYFYANALLRHYRRGEALGLDEQERSEYLLLSRYYFERMYQTNPRDVAAYVMLFYLDSHYYPGLQKQEQWLDKLDSLLDTRVLQASDWNALATLFEILSSGDDQIAEDAQITGLLDKLSRRYPGSIDVARFRVNYLLARHPESPRIIPLLEEILASDPQAYWAYLQLIHRHALRSDSASMYENARLWLANDRKRHHLLQLKSLFTASETDVDANASQTID